MEDEVRGTDASRLVEVGDKEVTVRVAVAEGTVVMTPDACRRLLAGSPKGDALEAGRVAGLLAMKRTADLLPFCHPVALTGGEVSLAPDPDAGVIRVRATARAADRTGVEMEALTAVAVAALSLYDTAKAHDRGVAITDVRLLEKRGGRSGEYRR
ncbi:MAG TPA: cyclic pyranopterin monophosphate synthase MoaC [Actinomycetota bacterium]|nr:cyclic pyranopterin monophosphate synthase MoaC [Actinomycetota bacterium]